jgi:hypothetical protein
MDWNRSVQCTLGSGEDVQELSVYGPGPARTNQTVTLLPRIRMEDGRGFWNWNRVHNSHSYTPHVCLASDSTPFSCGRGSASALDRKNDGDGEGYKYYYTYFRYIEFLYNVGRLSTPDPPTFVHVSSLLLPKIKFRLLRNWFKVDNHSNPNSTAPICSDFNKGGSLTEDFSTVRSGSFLANVNILRYRHIEDLSFVLVKTCLSHISEMQLSYGIKCM